MQSFRELRCGARVRLEQFAAVNERLGADREIALLCRGHQYLGGGEPLAV